VTFYHEAAPLILLRIGEDSAKEVPFLTSCINLIQFMYIYSFAYLSIRLAWIHAVLLYELIQVFRFINGLSARMLLKEKARNDNHLNPTLHDYPLVPSYIAVGLFSLGWYTYKIEGERVVIIKCIYRNPSDRETSRSTWKTFHVRFHNLFLHLNPKTKLYICRAILWLLWFSMGQFCL
jgi:hypothetical protein